MGERLPDLRFNLKFKTKESGNLVLVLPQQDLSGQIWSNHLHLVFSSVKLHFNEIKQKEVFWKVKNLVQMPDAIQLVYS